MRRIISIDPATITGSAWTNGTDVDHRTWTLTKNNQGRAILDMSQLLREFIAELGCDLLVCEDASFGSNNRNTAAFHNALRGAIEAIAEEHHLPLWKYNPSSLKAQTCGNGRATKQQMTDAVNRLYGVNCANDNEADAVAMAMLAANDVKPVGMVKRAQKRRVKRAVKKIRFLF